MMTINFNTMNKKFAGITFVVYTRDLLPMIARYGQEEGLEKFSKIFYKNA